AVVEDDDVQRVQQLTLVFVNPLYLAVKDAVRIDYLTCCRPHPVDETKFCAALGVAEGALELGIVCQWPKSGNLAKVSNPAIAQCFGDDAGERRIRHQ